MRRREFITLLGGAAVAWPLAARAEQSAMPVIGFVNPTAPEGYPKVIDEFRRGLAETGYVEGRNIIIEYRWAHGEYAKLPGLVDELVKLNVAVIAATGGGTAATAARTATAIIPIVFNTAGDPVKSGLVASLRRPGGNLTGGSRINTELLPKRLEFLATVLPDATSFAFLINPYNPDHESRAKVVESAGRILGRHILLFRSGQDHEIEEGLRQCRSNEWRDCLSPTMATSTRVANCSVRLLCGTEFPRFIRLASSQQLAV
jgi:putative ABC transport system substrate-binding protein